MCGAEEWGPPRLGAGARQGSRVWGKGGALERVPGWSYGLRGQDLGWEEELLDLPSLSCCAGVPGAHCWWHRRRQEVAHGTRGIQLSMSSASCGWPRPLQGTHPHIPHVPQRSGGAAWGPLGWPFPRKAAPQFSVISLLETPSACSTKPLPPTGGEPLGTLLGPAPTGD